MSKPTFMSLINKQVFFPPAILLIIAITLGAVFPTEFGNAMGVALGYITQDLGWLFTLGAICVVSFCLWAGFSKYGRIRLGGPQAKPIITQSKKYLY